MREESVIQVNSISKKFTRSLKRSMVYGLTDIGKNMFGMRSNSETLRKNEFWALDDISFDIKKGETIGVIGVNGSGKSTLLKLLNGIFWPDKGQIELRGKVGALIEVGAGFHPLLTGRENIYINAAILGMNKKEVDEKLDSIIDFADIGDFIDSPVKHYSSGMFVRLGFSVAIHCSPDILLVDEILSVGDLVFQRKSYNKIKELKNSGCSILLVSHSIGTILNNCERTICLKHGKSAGIGRTDEVINAYLSNQDVSDKLSERAVGIGILILDNPNSAVFVSDQNQNITIKIPQKVDSDYYLGISIRDSHGYEITGYNTKWDETRFPKSLREIIMNINTGCLSSGIYKCVIDVKDENFGTIMKNDTIVLNVESSHRTVGIINPKSIVRFSCNAD